LQMNAHCGSYQQKKYTRHPKLIKSIMVKNTVGSSRIFNFYLDEGNAIYYAACNLLLYNTIWHPLATGLQITGQLLASYATW